MLHTRRQPVIDTSYRQAKTTIRTVHNPEHPTEPGQATNPLSKPRIQNRMGARTRVATRVGKSDYTTRVRPDFSCPDRVRTRQTVRFIGPGSCLDTIYLKRDCGRT